MRRESKEGSIWVLDKGGSGRVLSGGFRTSFRCQHGVSQNNHVLSLLFAWPEELPCARHALRGRSSIFADPLSLTPSRLLYLHSHRTIKNHLSSCCNPLSHQALVPQSSISLLASPHLINSSSRPLAKMRGECESLVEIPYLSLLTCSCSGRLRRWRFLFHVSPTRCCTLGWR